jgi:hypothetical protein
MLETTPEKRRGPVRRRARMAAIPAMLLGLTVAGLGTAQAAHAGESYSCTTLPGATCPAPPPANKGKAKITGDAQHPGTLTQGKMQAKTLKLWQQIGWPNFHNVGDRDIAFNVEDYHVGATHIQHWIETGGRYYDNGNSLRDFMNRGEAGPSSRGYQGNFQEYVAHYFDHNPNGEGERTGQDRFVRAINTGDVWFTRDHYKSFTYLGKGPFS